jgi:hypothetical protein
MAMMATEICGRCMHDMFTCPDHPYDPVEATARHPKWQRVEPGHVIPAGHPYRVEFDGPGIVAHECIARSEWTVGNYEISDVFVDSSWRQPLELPTTPGSVVEAMGPSGITRLWFLRSTGEWMNENGTITDADTNLDLYRVLFDAGATQ